MGATTDEELEDNKAVVDRFITDVWNGADPGAIEHLADSDLVVHQLGGDIDRTSREEFETFVAEFRHAVPNLEQRVVRTVAEGDYVITYLTVTGTPQRQYGALRPTGKSFEVPGFQMFRLEDGKVGEVWILPNVMGTLKQLDLLPDSPGKIVRMLVGQAKQRLSG